MVACSVDGDRLAKSPCPCYPFGWPIAHLDSFVRKAVVQTRRPSTATLGMAQTAQIEAFEKAFKARFRILDYLGSGGVGEVFRVEQPGQASPIVVKWFYPWLTGLDLAGFKAQVAQECVVNPRCLKIEGIEEVYGRKYLLVEDAACRDLSTFFQPSDRITEEVLHRRIIPLIEAMSEAIAEMHEETFHGNLKPTNIFYEGGRVRFTDHLIPRLLTPSHFQQIQLSQGDAWYYMAPEYLTDEVRIGPAADQYALAAICFRLLSGVVPDARHESVASSSNPTLDAAVDAVFRRGLDPDPARRFPGISEFTGALIDALENLPPEAFTPRLPSSEEALLLDATREVTAEAIEIPKTPSSMIEIPPEEGEEAAAEGTDAGEREEDLVLDELPDPVGIEFFDLPENVALHLDEEEGFSLSISYEEEGERDTKGAIPADAQGEAVAVEEEEASRPGTQDGQTSEGVRPSWEERTEIEWIDPETSGIASFAGPGETTKIEIIEPPLEEEPSPPEGETTETLSVVVPEHLVSEGTTSSTDAGLGGGEEETAHERREEVTVTVTAPPPERRRGSGSRASLLVGERTVTGIVLPNPRRGGVMPRQEGEGAGHRQGEGATPAASKGNVPRIDFSAFREARLAPQPPPIHRPRFHPFRTNLFLATLPWMVSFLIVMVTLGYLATEILNRPTFLMLDHLWQRSGIFFHHFSWERIGIRVPVREPAEEERLAKGEEMGEEEGLSALPAEALEGLAQDLFAREYFLTPPERNAVLVCRELLRRRPEDPFAREMLDRIVTRYLAWGDRARESGARRKARLYYERALQVGRIDPTLGERVREASERLAALSAPLLPPPEPCPEDMVFIPAGSFPIGSQRNDKLRNFQDLSPAEATTAAFCIDRYEFPNKVGNIPRTEVTWQEAMRVCNILGRRLCTEEEWERACKGPAGTRFPYGNTWDPQRCNTEDARGLERTVEAIGSRPACRSGYGVFDMSGNVKEWTSSSWPGHPGEKVVRGGSSLQPDWAVRCASRENYFPYEQSKALGFRCCKDSNE
ncbi:MAG: hypothetical protein D6812_16190 [Deltaproteobacteria bacterium]|nr:MAG: hypothetical protein D6812_16190 [Deltaproteobacteria bacterium]